MPLWMHLERAVRIDKNPARNCGEANNMMVVEVRLGSDRMRFMIFPQNVDDFDACLLRLITKIETYDWEHFRNEAT